MRITKNPAVKSSNSIAIAAWMIAAVFYAYQYVLRVMPNIMLNDIMQQFNIDAAIFGQISGVYYIGYALLQIPIGIMLDSYGPKKVLPSCILLTVMGLLPLIFTKNWIYPICGSIIMGIGSAAAILGSFNIIRKQFKPQKFTRILSITITIGLVGAIYAGRPLKHMYNLWGYKTVIGIFAVLGLLLAGISYIILPEHKHQTTNGSNLHNLRNVITNPKVILCCCFAGLMIGPLEGFANVWGTEFFKHVYGLDPNTASYLPSMIFIGMCFGAPVLGIIAEKTGNYLGAIVAAGVFMLIIFTTLITKILPENGIALSFIIVGMCCAYKILAIYQAATYVSEDIAGITNAVANMIIMSFGYAFHAAIGLLVKTFSYTTTAKSFTYGISIIPLSIAIAVFGFIFLKYAEGKSSI